MSPSLGPAGRGGARRRTRRRMNARSGAMDQGAPQDNTQASQTDNSLEELEKLGELHEKGILTDEEFAAKKKQILG